MKKEKYFTKETIALLSLMGFFVVWIVLFALLRLSVNASEWWTRNVTIPYQTLVGTVTSWFPFSLTEIFVGVLIVDVIALVVLVVVLFSRRKTKLALKFLTFIGAIGLGVSSFYMSVSSLSYSRAKLDFIPQYEEVTQGQFIDIVTHYTLDFNATAEQLEFDVNGDVIMPYSYGLLSEKLHLEYSKINSDYLGTYTPLLKQMNSSWLFREFQITGISFGPLGEANINTLNTKMDIPFTSAHELAHQKGIMREEDANLVALYVCLNSDDPYLKFSGYMRSFASIYSLLGYTGNKTDKTEITNLMDENILKAYSYRSEYWSEHDILKNIAEFFNDLYLKLSGTSGVSSYDDTYTSSETGDKDDEGNPIFEFEFSPFQKLLFAIYH